MDRQKCTILYERLSRDDGEDSVSNSIKNQIDLLEKYAEDNNLKPYRHIQDDGFSGTGWNRPGWLEVMSEIEAGRVETLVVKNLDRMGRDYLRVGLLMEQFQQNGVRFIAVSDGIDSSKQEDDFTPFRAIFAEWYAKDASRKIRAVFKARTEAGYHCTGSIPYGYLHDPDNRQNWLIDEEAATVVRKIFQLVIEGNGVYQIAKILEQEKIMIPTAHWKAIGFSQNARHTYHDPYLWRGGVVSGILQREEYMGNKILRKTHSESYKLKKRKETPKDERLIFKGAIPQIVDEETWNLAQSLRKTVRRPAKNGEPPYRLTGLMFCGTCGAKMTHERSINYKTGKKKNSYICSNYRQRTRACSIHTINVPAVETLILQTIKNVAYYVRTNEAEFIRKVREVSAIQQESAVKESKKLLSSHKRRLDELDNLIKKLYESFATSKIPEKHFEKLLKEYDGEQASLETKISQLQSEIETWNSNIEKSGKFISLVKRYTDFDELTNQMVNEFIEKIVVHEAVKMGGKREQQVDIYLNFIGNFSAPIMDIPLSEKELKQQEKLARIEEEKAVARKAKSREKSRKWREKIKAEGKHDEQLAKRRAEYAEKRTSTKPYIPQNKTQTA
jgi:DNA invertase Pin-like site-specific DNA recombinase